MASQTLTETIFPSVSAQVSPSSSPLAEQPSPKGYSTTITSLVALGCTLFFVAYLCLVTLTWRYARSHPRPVNSKSGDVLVRWGPAFYMFVVVTSLIEISLASWLVLEYSYYYDSPNRQAFSAANFLIFDSAWTALTSGIYSVLFLHPTWALLPIASVGAQWIWLVVTWLLWIIGAGLLNGALPALIDERKCDPGVVFCSQIQGLFGLAVIQVCILTGAMLALIWLVLSMSRSKLGCNDDAPLKNLNTNPV